MNENLLSKLTSNIRDMISLYGEVQALNTTLYYISNLKDKKNYNEERAELTKKRSNELMDKFYELTNKWGIYDTNS